MNTGTKASSATYLLHVDDEQHIRDSVMQALRKIEPDCVIHAAETLDQALRAVSAVKYDCVILDLGLPDSQGAAGVRQLREADFHVPIIVYTDRDDLASMAECQTAGANGFLTKGLVGTKSLMQAIVLAMEERRNFIRMEQDLLGYRLLQVNGLACRVDERVAAIRDLLSEVPELEPDPLQAKDMGDER